MLVAAGVDGICIGGATGEYPHFESAERIAVIRTCGGAAAGEQDAARRHRVRLRCARRSKWGRPRWLPGAAHCCCRCRCSIAISRTIFARSRATSAGTGGAMPALRSARLHQRHRSRDGSRAHARRRVHHWHQGQQRPGRESRAVRGGARGLDWTLLVGDDRLLALGLQAGWDGGISGLACCCPELLVAISAKRARRRRVRDVAAAAAPR